MKKIILAACLSVASLTASFSSMAMEYTPAMQAVMLMQQSEFRGFKPGNEEMMAKLRRLGKIATADEMEEVLLGKKKDWVIIDIRSSRHYDGGRISVDGKDMIHTGRQRATAELEKHLIKRDEKGNIIQKAPKNIIIMCTTGLCATFDYASYATAGFNDVKVASVNEWVRSCKPIKSVSKIEDSALHRSGFEMKQHTDGMYYSDKCSVFK